MIERMATIESSKERLTSGYEGTATKNSNELSRKDLTTNNNSSGRAKGGNGSDGRQRNNHYRRNKNKSKNQNVPDDKKIVLKDGNNDNNDVLANAFSNTATDLPKQVDNKHRRKKGNNNTNRNSTKGNGNNKSDAKNGGVRSKGKNNDSKQRHHGKNNVRALTSSSVATASTANLATELSSNKSCTDNGNNNISSMDQPSKLFPSLNASAQEYTFKGPTPKNNPENGTAVAIFIEEEEMNEKIIMKEREEFEESYMRASADLELLLAAYPEEISIFDDSVISSSCHNPHGSSENIDVEDEYNSYNSTPPIPSWFPLIFTLVLPDYNENRSAKATRFSSNITMEFPRGYPTTQPLQIVSYRGIGGTTAAVANKNILEAAVSAVRIASNQALEYGEESGLACCAAALGCWRDSHYSCDHVNTDIACNDQEEEVKDDSDIHWITAENTLTDRKSVFQAHICLVQSEDMVRRAVTKLIEGSSKIQRATHNMYAYRFTETLPDGKTILKHDNDDDGEDAAGSRLAQLLEMRGEDGVLVLVSRWYGGTLLGPKRFAHIVNVARELLVSCHEDGLIH